MTPPGGPYVRRDLALVHHLGFGFHADACAPGILARLEPIRERGGLVLELLDTAAIPARLASQGVEVAVASSFGSETLPAGLRVLLGRRP